MASGNWRVRYRDSNGKDRYRTFTRKLDADRFKAETNGAKATGQHVNPVGERTLFRDVATEWLMAREASTRGTTQDYYASYLTNHVLPEFGGDQIGRIRRADIQRWVTRLSRTKADGGAELAPGTVESIYRILSSVMNHAVDERLISTSEARKISLPQRGVESHSIVPIQLEQVKRLAEAAGHYSDLVWFAASTGMRQGECLGLTADRVDLANRMIRVDRQLVTRSGRPPALGPPKTAASVRNLPIGQWTCDLIAERVKNPGENGFLFLDPKGAPIRRSKLGEVIRRAATATSVDATFHDLRHFYASMLIRSGLSVKVVQARLGHGSAVETLETYAHLWPDSEESTRNAIDSVFMKVEL